MTESRRNGEKFAALAKPGLLFALSGVLLAGCGGVPASTVPAALAAPVAYKPDEQKSKTFYYTGTQQNFTVPYGVKHVTITAIGAPTKAGHGGLVAATIAVAPGESLAVFVGGKPSGTTGGFNGGADGGAGDAGDGNGGGGASDVRQSGNKLSDRVIVAGGAGGGGAFHGGRGGLGGGLEGRQGRNGRSGDSPSGSYTGGFGGGGGSQTAGGAGGSGGGAGESGWVGEPGAAGMLASGGAGGGGCASCYGGGGGSGGSVGGPNGKGNAGGGGEGGGSGYAESSAKGVTYLPGGGGRGPSKIVISW